MTLVARGKNYIREGEKTVNNLFKVNIFVKDYDDMVEDWGFLVEILGGFVGMLTV